MASLAAAGKTYSSVALARSALSAILPKYDGYAFGGHPDVCRTVKGIQQCHPTAPRYSEIWDAKVVLDYCESLQDASLLSLKMLTFRLTMLLALSSGQRVQTLKALDINNMLMQNNVCSFRITQLLKHTGKGRSQEKLKFVAYEPCKALCVLTNLRQYLSLTASLRGSHSQLLISIQKPHLPVSADTIARWLKHVLSASGIGDNFSAHSTRAASTSYAKRAGLPIEDIMRCAGWSNARTFARFYDKPIISPRLSISHVVIP